MDADDGGRWLTKAELAKVRGISLESADRLSRRKRWKKQKGNDGRVRIWVPEGKDEPDRRTIQGGARQDNQSDGPSDLSRTISAFEAALTTLREQLTRESARADKAEAELATARAQLAAAIVPRPRRRWWRWRRVG